MGVDYDGVGGIGIEIDEDMQEKLRDLVEERGLEVDRDEYFTEILEEIGIEYCEAGSGSYGGDERYYFLVKGETFNDVKKNIPDFIKDMEKIGIKITEDDLLVISDLYVY